MDLFRPIGPLQIRWDYPSPNWSTYEVNLNMGKNWKSVMILAVIATARMKPGLFRIVVQGSLALGMAGVGVSRIYLGAHWLGDVVAAYAVGAALVAAAVVVWNYLPAGARRVAAEQPLLD